jgi:PTS system mannose-specific IID component
VTAPAAATPPAPEPIRLPLTTKLAMFTRLLAIQGSFNYEILVGNGIGFCVEPALRHLPGGVTGEPYRRALARQCHYFNAHPYLAAVAVGALARAELDGAPPAKIERFRTALCGPLGSVGDRLVWAGWVPLCSLVALTAFGLGAGPAFVVALFLLLYNAGHLALRAWGLRVGLAQGMRVAPSLANPVLRQGPVQIARVAALFAGLGVPLALHRVIGPGQTLLGAVLVAVAAGGVVLARLHGRVEGWRLALALLALVVLYSVSVAR